MRRSSMEKLLFCVLVIILMGNSVVHAKRKRENSEFHFRDCGGKTNRPVVFSRLVLSPTPIITPGTLYISMAGNITRELPRKISIQLEVTKYWIGIPFMLPCFNEKIGSCLYENICKKLAVYEERKRCPKMMRSYNLQCYCPFRAGEFNFNNLALNIPNIGGFAGAFVKVRGSYGVSIKILDEHSDELGCIQMNFSLKKRNKGWLFRI